MHLAAPHPHPVHRRPVPAAAALTLTLLAGSGCGPGREPNLRQLPPLLPAQVASSTQPAAVAAGSAGAVRAARRVVRRYYGALDRLRSRMRVAPLAALLAPDCPCQAQVRAVRDALRRGERYTDRVRLIGLVAHLDRPDLVDVVVTLDVHHGGLVDRDGRRLGPATTVRNLHREIQVRRVAGRWQIGRVIVV